MATYTIYIAPTFLTLASLGSSTEPAEAYAQARSGDGSIFDITGFLSWPAIGQELSIPGASYDYSIIESFVSFDTSVIGANETVTSATLKTAGEQFLDPDSVQPFNIEVRGFDWNPGGGTANWIPGDSIGTYPLLATLNSANLSGSLTSYNSTPDFKDYINTTGITRFALVSENTRINQPPPDVNPTVFEEVSIYDIPTPELVIETITNEATGTGSPTIPDFTAAGSGSVTSFVGSAAPTISPFTAAASGTLTLTGSAFPTVAAFVSAAQGAVGVRGTAAPTVTAFVAAATGQLIHAHGTGTATLEPFTATASGVTAQAVDGEAAPTIADFTQTVTGWVEAIGTASVAVGDFTSSASGALTIAGTAAPILVDFIPSASGAVGVSGSAAPPIEQFLAAASGQHIEFHGTSATTFDAFTPSASGTLTLGGTASPVIGGFTADAAGQHISYLGVANIQIDPFVTTTSGQASVTGSADIVVQDFICATDFYVTIVGRGRSLIGDFT